MKEKISEIFKSKTFYIVFSIILAIGAWLLVIDSKNPRDSRTIEVPISFVNKNVLEEKDLVDNSATTLPTTVTVKISGAEVFLDRVQPSDFYVEVDYNQVTGPGAITLEIKEPVCEPLGISVDSYYPMNIERIYDKTVEKYMDVSIEWNDDVTAKGVSVVNAVAEPSNILVTGYSLNVNRIASVKVNLADLGTEIKESGSVSLPCHFYDSEGVEITRDFQSEKVVVRYTIGKIVPVKYNITGTVADGYYVSSHLPSVTSVTLTGDTDKINKISSLDLGSVSTQDRNQNFVKSIVLSKLLPEGVSVVGVTQVDVSVNINKYSEKKIVLGNDKLKVSGENPKFTYSYNLNAENLIVKGTEKDLAKVSEDNIVYSVDVNNLEEGIHESVAVMVTLPEGVSKTEDVTCRIEVTKPVTTPGPDITDGPIAEVTATPENSIS